MNAPEYYLDLVGWLLSHVNTTDMFLLPSVAVCGALFWLLHRAWLTLRKPTPELISVLGVEVPEAPEVSLAGFKTDTVTLTWTRPGSSRPVHKYLIQVNGVNVGNSQPRETAITVTGLKAGHFYNVRVIAVGSNNFQAGSRVIRFRTFGKDGRPELGNGRVPSNLVVEEANNGPVVESSDEGTGVRAHGAGVETATNEAAPAMVREASSGHGQRRNTGGRRHSPSTASDHPPIPRKEETSESMMELTERFNAIKNEHQSIGISTLKEKEEFEALMIDLTKKKDEKQLLVKEKEEASEKLKREANISERLNRQAQTRKANKEKALREKQAERKKMHEDMARWEREIKDMKLEREKWQTEREELTESTEKNVEELRDILRKRQNSLNGMEEEIRVKGLQLRELEDERKNLPGGEDDDDAKEMEALERHREFAWEQKERDLMQRFSHQTNVFHGLKANLEQARNYQAALLESQTNSSMMYGSGAATGVDFETSSLHQPKSRRKQGKSRTNTISTPISSQPITDSTFPGANIYSSYNTTSPSFAPGPFYDMSADLGLHSVSDGMSESDIRALTGGAPLSPTATSLLPTGLFGDDEPPSPEPMHRALGPSLFADDEEDSTESSSHSASRISSPRTSGNNLPYYHPKADDDHHSLNASGADFGVIGSPNTGNHSANTKDNAPRNSFQELFNFPKSRSKTMQAEGPALGSLKAGQSHSFPRQTDDGEGFLARNRRTSFSTGLSSFLSRGHSDVAEGNAPAMARNVARRRGFKLFGSSIDDPAVGHPERDPSSPRPASIASSDLPRPSMDSAPFGWSVGSDAINRNSPLATNWSANYAAPPPGLNAHPWNSRNPSRRPSLQHGSSSALNGVADDDDEFLPADLLPQQSSPPPVGIIGGPRPQSSKSQTPRLNPNAPAFMAIFSRSGKDRNAAGHKKNSLSIDDDQDEANSPSDSRKSKDQYSIHTLASMTESYDSLDRVSSNTPSDAVTPSHGSKDGTESSFHKLFRKSSSSKFSMRSVSNWSKSKTGTPVSATADRNASGDRGSSFGDMTEEQGEESLGRSVDSVTSSPMIGSQVGTPKERKSAWNRFSISSARKDKGKDKDKTGGDDDGRMSLTSGAETTEDERDE